MEKSEWYKFALKEIDGSRKRLSAWDKDFLETIRPRVKMGMFLSDRQEESLTRIHMRMTDIIASRRYS